MIHHSERCIAVSGRGQRCKLKAQQLGLCHRHYALLEKGQRLEFAAALPATMQAHIRKLIDIKSRTCISARASLDLMLERRAA